MSPGRGRPPKGTLKWGDTNAKKKDVDRELSEPERLHVIACYQKTEDLEKCAKEVCTTWERASEVVTTAIQNNPQAFHSGEASMGMSIMCQFICVQAMKQSARNIGKLDSVKAILTAKYSGQMADSYDKTHKAWSETTGGTDIEEIKAERLKTQRQLAAIEQDGVGAEDAATGAAGTTPQDPGTVEADG